MVARGRPSGPKTRCSGQWTEAKFRSFIKNQLRAATMKWAPITQCKSKAHVSRGVYRCAECLEDVPATIMNEEKRKREKNIFIDHIKPIIDPAVGFVDWNTTVDRMFCELDNLQLLCKKCHDEKTYIEKQIAKERRIEIED